MKKKILFNSSAGYKNVLGDILPVVNLCKDHFDCYIGIKDLEDEVHEDGITYLPYDKSKYRYIMYTAEYVVDSGTLNSTRKVYGGAKWINIWHGIPIKKMLLDEGLAPDKFINFMRYYDHFISSSPYYTDILRKSFLFKGDVLELGSPRYDVLFDETIDNTIYDELNLDKNKKVILYAPTFRARGEFTIPFDVKKLLNELGSEYQLVVKAHYLNTLKADGDFIDATNYTSINELFKISEVLIADYSSLIFDYSLLGKKVVLYQYDKQEYFENRGVYFDLVDYFPDQICETEAELVNLIKRDEVVDYGKFIHDFLPYEDGNSSQRLVDTLITDSEVYGMKEVIFVVNQLHEIGGVHNFIKGLAENIKKHRKCKIILIAATNKNFNNRKDYVFESEYIDLVLTPQINRDAIHKILENTDGYIISTQLYAHTYFQRLMADKNVICMFHADVEYAKTPSKLFTWEMEGLANGDVQNVKSYVMLTDANATALKPIIKADTRITHIENGINIVNHPSTLDGHFIFISRIEQEQKNVFALIDIANEIRSRGLDYKIDVYGAGPDEEEFIDKINEDGLSEILIFKGYASNPFDVYANARGHLMVSTMEGLPFTILETLSVGVPTIVYDTFLAASDVIKNDNNGYLIDFGDVKSFVDAMEKVSDDSKIKILSANSIEMAKKYEYSNIVKRWFEEFEIVDSIEQEKSLQASKKRSDYIGKISNKFKKFKMDAINGNYFIRPKKSKKMKRTLFPLRYLLSKAYRSTPMFKKESFGLLINDFPTRDCVDMSTVNVSEYDDLISVVIPSYNSAKTVTNTIQSVLKQYHKKVEILVIDDGSVDNTKEVVSRIRDKRVKYFYKENEGLGPTRNYGVKQAKGKYVFFLDADDTIPKDALISLYYPAKYHDLDVVSGKTLRFYKTGSQKRYFWMKGLYGRFNITNVHENLNLLNDTLSTNKLYRVEMFEKHDIWFEKVLYEDKLFISQVYSKIDRVGLVDRHVYNWFIYGENTSITTFKDINNLLERISTVEKIYNKVDNIDVTRKITDFLIAHDFKIYINEYDKFSEEDRKRLFEIIKNTMKDRWQYLKLDEIWRGENYIYALAVFNDDFEEFNKVCLAHASKK